MSASPAPWPTSLVGTPTVSVIERAIERQRLSHSLLLHGDDLETLVEVAHAIADRLLSPATVGGASRPDKPSARLEDPSRSATPPTPTEPHHFAPDQHPDCYALRPAGKMRQISAEATRDLISKVQVSGSVSQRKVAIIHEADRMHVAAANVFLKTLEEPPANTTLLLLTTRPYALLPTIRSRVLHFRFPSATAQLAADGWAAWLDDYKAWLTRLTEGVTDKSAVADSVFTVYGLIARFGAVLDFATDEIWKQQKQKLPADLGDDEQVAIETGIANGLRSRLFGEIEQATRAFALPRLTGESVAPEQSRTTRRALVAAIEQLEHDVGLLRLNLNESAALEHFLLSSLRLWSKR
jgi:DNA polymerase-3 subunit delta'